MCRDACGNYEVLFNKRGKTLLAVELYLERKVRVWDDRKRERDSFFAAVARGERERAWSARGCMASAFTLVHATREKKEARGRAGPS